MSIEFFFLAVLIGGAFYFFRKKSKQRSQPLSDWMRGFIVFHAANKAAMSGGTDAVYQEISHLVQEKLNFFDQQSIIVWLKGYILETTPPHSDLPNDLKIIIKQMPYILKSEIAGYDTPAAIEHFLKIEDPEFRGQPQSQVDEMVQNIYKIINSNDADSMQLKGILMRARLKDTFVKLHGMPLEEFSNRIVHKIEHY